MHLIGEEGGKDIAEIKNNVFKSLKKQSKSMDMAAALGAAEKCTGP